MAMKALRRERKWSQEQLADLSGLSLRTIQRIEGSDRAGYTSLRALASAFEIEISDLELELAMDKSSSGWWLCIRALGYARYENRACSSGLNGPAIAGRVLDVFGRLPDVLDHSNR